MAISARTQTCGVVLHPAAHSRSPAMHNAAFRALGIDAVYTAFDVRPADLGDAIAGMRALGIRQLAVSLPHKQAVMAYLDEIDDTARRIGAVNTVTLREDRLHGTNTDWLGAVRTLEGSCTLGGARAVVLGAGGTARAVTFGLLERGAHVCVLNRTPATAEALAGELGADDAGPLGSLAEREFDVLVNTTRVGLGSNESPVPARSHRSGAVVLDAVYEPARTRFLREAEAAGSRPLQGKWMLVHQAAEQIRLWTGSEAPIEVMARAFDEAGKPD